MSDTSIQLTWEPAYEKEGIISYELRYMESTFGGQVRILVFAGFYIQEMLIGRCTSFKFRLVKRHIFNQQMKKTFGPTTSYVVEGLRPNTEYRFSLAAISNKGIGAFTNDITQKTLQASM